MSETMQDYKKPIPVPSQESQPYWDGLREQKLMMPRCDDCESYRAGDVPSGKWATATSNGAVAVDGARHRSGRMAVRMRRQ